MLTCPSCHASFRNEDVDFPQAIATCRRCCAVFDLSGRTVTLTTGPMALPKVTRPKVRMPAGVEVTEVPGGTRLEWRWSRRRGWVLLVTSLLWTFLFYIPVALQPLNPDEIPRALLLAHGGVNLFLAWWALASLFNRTRIDLTPQALRIRSGPLPFGGNHHFDREALEQLYVTRRVIHGDHRVDVRWSLNAVLKGGKHVKLVSRLESRDQALYLEQRIEETLGIEDRPVPGEVLDKVA